MQTQILDIDDPQALNAVDALLEADDIFVAPTDTVYGVFCRYDSPVALARIYTAKDRPPQKAIPVLISHLSQLDQLVQTPFSSQVQALMECFWPGPLTLILPAQTHLPPDLTAGASTVAVRMPDHAALRALLDRTGALAATSANRSGQTETHSVPQVLVQLSGRVPLILADKSVSAQAATGQPSQPVRLASTIVDVADPAAPPRILREGPLGQAVRELLSAPSDRPAPDAQG